ncbi:MAG: uroporphyrinogen-III C-methyltransferase [Pseudomonadota bacterium]
MSSTTPEPESASAADSSRQTSTSSSNHEDTSAATQNPLGFAALVLAAVACIAVFSFWQNQSSLLQDLGSAREAAGAARADVANTSSAIEMRLANRIDNQESTLRQLAPAVSALEVQSAQGDAAIEALGRTVEGLTLQLSEVRQSISRNEQALADAGGVLRNARDRWVMAEAEYLMQTANTALALAGDRQVALAALEAADDHLASLTSPRLTTVREALAADIGAVQAMPRTDVSGVAISLGALAAQALELPLLEDRTRNLLVEGGDPQEPAGWGRARAAFQGALSSLVSFRRDDSPVIPLLEPDEKFFLHRNLELQLLTARLACLKGDQINYRVSIEAAQRTLTGGGFDLRSGSVNAMREQLGALWEVQIAPERPDISASLVALREASERSP